MMQVLANRPELAIGWFSTISYMFQGITIKGELKLDRTTSYKRLILNELEKGC